MEGGRGQKSPTLCYVINEWPLWSYILGPVAFIHSVLWFWSTDPVSVIVIAYQQMTFKISKMAEILHSVSNRLLGFSKFCKKQKQDLFQTVVNDSSNLQQDSRKSLRKG